ncbi:MAG TPA: CopG family antitoxin [Acidobacteriota bacterium]|jgi:predicted DNA binding CopG/RHH family protein
MKKSAKKIPQFRTEDDEFDFWSIHDSVDFFKESDEVHEKLEITKPKRPKQRITMLLDAGLKSRLKKIAAEKGIPYQTLIQMWLREKVNQEIRKRTAS